jgi:hypothetical protein
MVRKLTILGFILVVAAANMAWAETFAGAIPAPAPTVMPAAAPAVCGPAGCAPAKVKAPVCKPPRLTTSIEVNMSYPQPKPMPMMNPCLPPPIPVAVPMWKFIVPWPPFVYYLPVE